MFCNFIVTPCGIRTARQPGEPTRFYRDVAVEAHFREALEDGVLIHAALADDAVGEATSEVRRAGAGITVVHQLDDILGMHLP